MMGESDDQEFEGDHETAKTTTSFTRLLFGDSGGADVDLGQAIFSSFPSHDNTPKMLCFGDHHQTELMFGQSAMNTTITPQKSGLTCTHSSSASSVKKAPSKSNTKRNGARDQPASQRTNKKSKVENVAATLTGHAKVMRKEKIGDRIRTLQQLVSPFGKTDTASVLHEAMGYIRFLHDQVQALCSPYLQQQQLHHDGGEVISKELKCRGLCLVPISCTVHVANSTNGADLWSSAVTHGRQ